MHCHTVRSFAVFAVITCVSFANAIEIWATDNLGTTNSASIGDRIIKFDSANPTGTVVTVGATTVANRGMSGLDFAGSGVLYAASGFNSDGTAFGGSQLFTINTGTGAATLIGSLGLPTGLTVSDLSWNPVSGQMQALVTSNGTAGPHSLWTVNLATAAATLVGNITGLGATSLPVGMATSSGGVNFLHNLVDDRMYSMAGLVASGMSATIGIDTNFSQGMTMNWSGADEWLLGSISNNPVFASQVRLMDNTTGGTTTILGTWPNTGSGGLPQFETGDLAIAPTVVPEPATLAALGLGFAALLRRRRK